MLYFDLPPNDLLRILLIKDKVLYKVSKSFLKLYMKMLDDINAGDINPDMYFNLLPTYTHKIPDEVINSGNDSVVVINGGTCNYYDESRNLLTNINNSMTGIYLCRSYSNHALYVFCLICKYKGSYMILELYHTERHSKLIMYIKKSWKKLISIYTGSKDHPIEEYNLIDCLYENNDYDINMIKYNVLRKLEYLKVFIKLSLLL